MNYAVITAAGSGTRFGGELPKQFVEVLGKPVIAYTLENYQRHPDIDGIVVVCQPEYRPRMEEIIACRELSKVVALADGGDSFGASVKNGVDVLLKGSGAGRIPAAKDSGTPIHGVSIPESEEDVIIIQAGVSPLTDEAIISDVIRMCREKGNAASAIDFFEAAVEKESSISIATGECCGVRMMDRSKIACVYGPWGFQRSVLRRVYEENRGPLKAPLDLFIEQGNRLYFSLGSQYNIKITKKEDLDFFEAFVRMKQGE